ncbi:MAG: condensation domain-containing protein, partial [Tumebacillaceae bacterium]
MSETEKWTEELRQQMLVAGNDTRTDGTRGSREVPVLQLPTDRPRAAVQTFQGAVHRVVMQKRLVEAVEALAKEEGASLDVALLAAFQTLLYRYTGQEDVPVGVAGWKGESASAQLLRTELSGGLTFRELIGRVREVALGASVLQDVRVEETSETVHSQAIHDGIVDSIKGSMTIHDQSDALLSLSSFEVMFAFNKSVSNTLQVEQLLQAFTGLFALHLVESDEGLE